jgi:hypothetical protein
MIVAMNSGTSEAARAVDVVLFACLAFLDYIPIHFLDPFCKALYALSKTLMYVPDS